MYKKGIPMNDSDRAARSGRFRSAIAAFIEGRREAKLKGKDEDADAASKYDYSTWLADAARRVGQIQAVTHTLKATHPDARGSSLRVTPGALPEHADIGTHSLGERFEDDVVGNAAALDVYKFLKIEVDGRRLLDWMQAGDADLLAALHADTATAEGWMESFNGLVRSDAKLTSHEAAKQIYWCIGDAPSDDAQFHLLQPLFSSSLAQAVHEDINDARFGESNKLARQAFRDKTAHDTSYLDYQGLVTRKLGGTKPQNVSQLNSERGGLNYLLASLPPPQWNRQASPGLRTADTALQRFAYFDGVGVLMLALIDFLKADPPKNEQTRTRRESIEQALGLQLAAYATYVQACEQPGWSRDSTLKLPQCEQLWLDQERTELPVREDFAEEDLAFNVAFAQGNWPDEVASRFAKWVNEQLRASGITSMGDAEYKHWARQAILDAAWPIATQRRAGGVQ
jgi:CRISPR-associated protein Csy1